MASEHKSLSDERPLNEFDARSLASAPDPLSKEELHLTDAFFRATNYLTVGQIYLRENPLLQEPLKVAHIKPRLLGHFGTSPGLNLVYVHANRLIRQTNADILLMVGPGHGGPAIVANVYLERTWEEVYPKGGVSNDLAGLRKLFRQFSAPGGIPSHCSPDVPGSIHEGGELGYVLTHAFGAAFDNPDLIVLAIVGDGEAETGPLEGSWKGISFLSPVHDGAVLPVLHLNDGKIGSPTVLGRESDALVRARFESYGYEVLFVEGDEPLKVHQDYAKAQEYAYAKIRAIQREARANGSKGVAGFGRPKWPMIVLRTPKGWTGPKKVDGVQIEGTPRSHQVPLSGVRDNPAHLAQLESWLRSYRPEELFTKEGALREELQALTPKGSKRMSATPYANGGGHNGGKGARQLQIPALEKYALKVTSPGGDARQCSTAQLGQLCRDLYGSNPTAFRFFCPDETASNRFQALYETQQRAWQETVKPEIDEALGPQGRVMEVLSEHNVNGWLEGYILTGRHALLATYEAFSMVFLSMTLQTVKWLEVVAGSDKELPLTWRKPVPSVNILLTSTCWRNDHNGFSHQGPGFLDALITKKGSVVRAYLPPDANCLLVTAEHVFNTQNRVNVIVQDKQVQLQYLSLDEARAHFKAGISRWGWASNDGPNGSAQEPDVIVASCGDCMTLESLAAVAYLRQQAPSLRIRFINVLDLFRLYTPDRHPHGATEEQFVEWFTEDKPVVVAFHSYPTAWHQLVHRRSNPIRFHVRGYSENGTTTTPFLMCVLNEVSRFDLAQLVLKHARNPPANAAAIVEDCHRRLAEARAYAIENMEDMPEIDKFKWEREWIKK